MSYLTKLFVPKRKGFFSRPIEDAKWACLRVWDHYYNPTAERNGRKLWLKRRKGPAVLSWHIQTVRDRDPIMLSNYKTPEEAYRVEKNAFMSFKGKSKPKKGQGKKAKKKAAAAAKAES
eukprot:TRINITY_DN11514_c0_g1_i1.p1 TRINITY_DN11514_c0_g1~~TRINITY_DN11514_c0_g1_i1.p1  ORF type:complete len:119 (-),score=23.01 TRINITY_DN11514_c0_g1_i1:106-462(-)